LVRNKKRELPYFRNIGPKFSNLTQLSLVENELLLIPEHQEDASMEATKIDLKNLLIGIRNSKVAIFLRFIME